MARATPDHAFYRSAYSRPVKVELRLDQAPRGGPSDGVNTPEDRLEALKGDRKGQYSIRPL